MICPSSLGMMILVALVYPVRTARASPGCTVPYHRSPARYGMICFEKGKPKSLGRLCVRSIILLKASESSKRLSVHSRQALAPSFTFTLSFVEGIGRKLYDYPGAGSGGITCLDLNRYSRICAYLELGRTKRSDPSTTE